MLDLSWILATAFAACFAFVAFCDFLASCSCSFVCYSMGFAEIKQYIVVYLVDSISLALFSSVLFEENVLDKDSRVKGRAFATKKENITKSKNKSKNSKNKNRKKNTNKNYSKNKRSKTRARRTTRTTTTRTRGIRATNAEQEEEQPKQQEQQQPNKEQNQNKQKIKQWWSCDTQDLEYWQNTCTHTYIYILHIYLRKSHKSQNTWNKETEGYQHISQWWLKKLIETRLKAERGLGSSQNKKDTAKVKQKRWEWRNMQET